MARYVGVHLVPFVHSELRVHRVPSYNLAGNPLDFPQGPLQVPGPQFENYWSKRQRVLHLLTQKTDVALKNIGFIVMHL